jgi:sulfur-carrier protein
MSIHVLFFATLAELTGLRHAEVSAVEHPDVGAIFNNFATSHPRLEARRGSILCAVNSEFARFESPVRDGDEVAFFPPVSGG